MGSAGLPQGRLRPPACPALQRAHGVSIRAVLPLFFLSGAAGLIYQVSWVRHFGLIFGGTVPSAAAVTGTFMAALGLGAWAGGAWVDRHPEHPLRTYGLVECVVALLGLGLALGLPELQLTPSWSLGAEGWLWPDDLWRRVLLAVGLVGPPAALMGATMPLLARHLLHGHVDASGWRMGLLLAANTSGAAAGALATDLWLVPALGVFGTQLVAVGLGMIAGLMAFLLPDPTGKSRRLVGATPLRPAVALALGGAAVMGLEVVWLRFLGSSLGQFRAALSLTLATVLVGLWAGSLMAGGLSRMLRRPRLLLGMAQISVAVLALWGFASFDPERVLLDQLSLPPLAANLATAVRLVLPAAVAMGLAFPLANAWVQGPDEEVGRRVGLLFGAGSLGNLLGALVTGFVLLPGLGMQNTLLVLAGLSVAAGVVVLPLRHLPWAIPGVAALLLFARLEPGDVLNRSFPSGRLAQEGVIAMHEGVEQTLVITGSIEGPARLWTSGHPMASTTAHAQRYMRFLAHLPLLLRPAPERALVICFGVGNTTHAASLHPTLRQLDLADLSAGVLRHAAWFAHANHDVLADPRVRVHVDDGRRVLAAADRGPYDLVTLEPPPIAYAGVSALYSRRLYELIEARLAQGGLVSQWVPGYQVPAPAVRSLVRAFVDVFPDAILFVADRQEMVLVGQKGGIQPVQLAALQARLDARPAVAADLARIGLTDARALTDRFAGSGLDAVVSTDPPVTDDRPILEYAQQNQVTETRLPAALFDPTGIHSWCTDCPVPEANYRTEDFLRFSNRPD